MTDEHADMPDEEPEIDIVPTDVIYGFIRQLPDGYRMIFNLYVVEDGVIKKSPGCSNQGKHIGFTVTQSQSHLGGKIRSYQKECQIIGKEL